MKKQSGGNQHRRSKTHGTTQESRWNICFGFLLFDAVVLLCPGLLFSPVCFVSCAGCLRARVCFVSCGRTPATTTGVK